VILCTSLREIFKLESDSFETSAIFILHLPPKTNVLKTPLVSTDITIGDPLGLGKT
jgi:hypothetical protein